LGDRAKIREGKPITLPNDSEPEPHIAIVQPLGDLYKTERHPQVLDIFWVIEYANISREKDLELKRKIYAQASIAEYWVINVCTRELIVLREPNAEDYRSQIIMSDGKIGPVNFPDIPIEVKRLTQ
jgi:Uma2 family endonuclease